MQRLHLDFLRPAPRRQLPGAALLALGIAVAGAAAWRHHALVTEVSSLGERLAAQRAAARERPPRGAEPKQLATEVGRANAVLASLGVPWDAMFAELEAAASETVALLVIEPAAGGRIRLAGEARRFDDLLAYVVRLEATPGFANVFLAGHELRGAGPDRPVAFTLAADWVGRR
jgi:Tfp pilus assembly protein PilN